MSHSTIKIAITSHLKNLGTLLPGYHIVWPNAGNNAAEEATVNKYAVVSVIFGSTDRADIGTSGSVARRRTTGLVQVALHGQLGVGENEQLELADQVAALMRHQSVASGGVVFRTPNVQTRGRTADGRNWRVDVTAPFYADATS